MYTSETEIENIAQKTIENVRSHFRHIEQDSGVLRAFQFLVFLALPLKKKNQKNGCPNMTSSYRMISLLSLMQNLFKPTFHSSFFVF